MLRFLLQIWAFWPTKTVGKRFFAIIGKNYPAAWWEA